MADSAFEIYKSISYQRIVAMITDGEEEDLHLECKAPSTPRLEKAQKFDLARALSGFSNTAGGIVLWGVSTTSKKHSDTDVLSQIEEIGNCRKLERDILTTIPTLTTPPVLEFQSKRLLKRKNDTRGLIATYVPRTTGDPIQVAKDGVFYFRCGDRFEKAPYEMIKRLFAATQSPDLIPIVKVNDPKGPHDHEFRVMVSNRSSAAADHVKVLLKIDEPSPCDIKHLDEFQDMSSLNPGKYVLSCDVSGMVHRGLNQVAGAVGFSMRVDKKPKRALNLTIKLFANHMIARECRFSILVTKKGMTIKDKGMASSF